MLSSQQQITITPSSNITEISDTSEEIRIRIVVALPKTTKKHGKQRS
jgi:hypothetical protein